MERNVVVVAWTVELAICVAIVERAVEIAMAEKIRSRENGSWMREWVVDYGIRI